MFDLLTRTPLQLIERPLVAMESSVMDNSYMGLGTSMAALETFGRLKDACRRHQGDFTLLWHNSRLTTEAESRLYEKVLDA